MGQRGQRFALEGSQITFNPTLTRAYKARTLEFAARLKADGKVYFTSDDFRQYKLDKYMKDPAHEIGAYFRWLKFNGYITRDGQKASRIESNNFREIKKWRWHARVEGWLKEKVMDTFITNTVEAKELGDKNQK